MDLKQFILIAEKLGLPSGNYMFKSKHTLIIYWFMVCQDEYHTTILEVFKPGARRYPEIDQARRLHRALDKHQIHKQIVNQITN